MIEELKSEVARVSKLISEAQHAAAAAIYMGGTGAPHIERRDTLLNHVRSARTMTKYCQTCGAGPREYNECEEPDCEIVEGDTPPLIPQPTVLSRPTLEED